MAYNFTAASSQYLTTNGTPIAAAPFTISCWVKPNNNTTTGSCVVLRNTGSQERFQLSINAGASPKRLPQIVALNSTGAFGTSIANYNINYSANIWYNVTCTVATGTNNMRAWNNGEIGSLTSNETLNVSVGGVNQISIGGYTPTSAFIEGNLAHVGIWNVVLSSDEIKSLAKGMGCNKIRPQALKFHAPLIRNLQDISQGRSITNNNAVTVSDHPRIY